MKNLREYSIAFRGLSNGIHHFKYAINKDFFSMIEDSMIEDGDLTAEVEMIKSEQMLKLNFFISGIVKTTCDVCLGTIDCTIEDCEESIIVKFGQTTEEIDETLYQLAHEEDELSVAQWIYEFICTSLPVRITHEDGECDKDMLEKLQHYLVTDVNIEGDDDEEEYDEESEESESKNNSDTDNNDWVDPRWETLKGLRDKNK